MLHLKCHPSRQPKLEANTAIKILHLICYHIRQDRTPTENMSFGFQTFSLSKIHSYRFLSLKKNQPNQQTTNPNHDPSLPLPLLPKKQLPNNPNKTTIRGIHLFN